MVSVLSYLGDPAPYSAAFQVRKAEVEVLKLQFHADYRRSQHTQALL